MTLEEYYKKLKEKYEKTNWDDLESIKEYNEFRRNLYKQLRRD